jgi:hypothetical protein
MKASYGFIALALIAALIGVTPMIGGADTTTAAGEGTEPTDQQRAEDGRVHSNSPHPAVQSFRNPVYPIGVPNPPVSLERY